MLIENRQSGPVPIAVAMLDHLAIEIDRAEVLRYLGYPSGTCPSAAIEERVREAISVSQGKVSPRGTYSLYSVISSDADSLTLAGGITFTGRVGEFLGQAQRAAIFLATAGPEVDEMGQEAWRSGDAVGNLVYHALGATLVETVVDRIAEHLRRHAGPREALTLRYSPGYCGISLSQQRTIFRLVDAGPIGVELLPSLIMKPLKSVSGMIGIGLESDVTAYGNPCARCPLLDCPMRR